MRFSIALGLAAGLAFPALPGLAATAEREEDCGFQAQVVEAVRQARLDRVAERKVADHIAATEPGWPDRYDTAIPLVTPWVYEMKMRVVKAEDLAAAWKELCLQQ